MVAFVIVVMVWEARIGCLHRLNGVIFNVFILTLFAMWTLPDGLRSLRSPY